MTEATDALDDISRQLRLALAGDAVICDLTISRDFAIEILNLWSLLVQPDNLALWFAPVHGELRPGGAYQVEGNASGAVTSCDAPFGFEATWEYGESKATIIVALTEVERTRTSLSLRSIGLIPADAWREYGPGAVGIGWDLVMSGLWRHIRAGNMAAGADTGRMSPEETRTFINRSSQEWAERSIAAGTPGFAALSAEARAAAVFLSEL